MEFKKLHQQMCLFNVEQLLETTLKGIAAPLGTLELVHKTIDAARVDPRGLYMAQARAVSERGRSTGVDWEDFWSGVMHGITIATASTDPDLMKAVRWMAEAQRRGAQSDERI